MSDRETGGIGCQFIVDDEMKHCCEDKIAISENRTGISSVARIVVQFRMC
jgi:hypothetical protein